MASVISEWSARIGKIKAGEMDRLVNVEYDMTYRQGSRGELCGGFERLSRPFGVVRPSSPRRFLSLFCGPTGTGTCYCDCCDLTCLDLISLSIRFLFVYFL
jgi:hypothetical protein